MWVVIPKKTTDSLDYIVTDTVSGEECGKFDCPKWAQTYADELNSKKEGGVE